MWRCGVHLETVRLRIGISATRLQNQGQGIVPPGLVTSEMSCGTLSPSKGRKAGCHPAWWRACQNVRWYALRLTKTRKNQRKPEKTMGTLCVLQKPEKTNWFSLVFSGFLWFYMDAKHILTHPLTQGATSPRSCVNCHPWGVEDSFFESDKRVILFLINWNVWD